MLTVYAFSADNWRRPEVEVKALMRLLRSYLVYETDRCITEGVRIQFVGRRDRLSKVLVETMEMAEARTRDGARLTLRIALDYSSRDALVQAAQKMAERGRFDRQAMDEALEAEDIDLVIRTAGEQRLSNFLPWQANYAEYVTAPALWPDFTVADYRAALKEFQGRERRFGSV